MNVTDQLTVALAGRYVIDREIGAGGMATVYLARDVKHNRPVALKVLKPELGAVLGVERFLAEIEVTANLQHPNLLPLFDSGEANGLLFYVMPYIEGESLRARISREKQLPVAEAVRLGEAIASALDYAHRHGVIHRDLKPENVLLHEGQPLVTDFGIALAVSNAGGNRITQTGLSLGTPQYMSPEQATGDRAIDARTDVYSLGAMLYELLSGDPPHSASTAQAIIAKVLTERPQSVRISRASVPDHVDFAIMRALEKLPADRWATAAEFCDALMGKSLVVRAATMPQLLTAQAQVIASWRGRAITAATVIAALAVGAVGGIAIWTRTHRPALAIPVRFNLDLPASLPLVGGSGSEIILTPDGRTLIYRTTSPSSYALARRPLDRADAAVIPGTEDAVNPAISPDSRWIVFVAGGQIKKVPIDGGIPSVIATRNAGGLAWGPNGIIVLTDHNQTLMWVPASGGAPKEFARPDSAAGETGMRWPLLLDDGKTVLYTSWRGDPTASLALARIGITSIDGGGNTILELPGTFPMAVVDDHLIYARNDGPIMGVPIDIKRRRITGEAVVLVEAVTVGTGGASKATVSSNGTLVYRSGTSDMSIALVDEHGVGQPLIIPKDRASSSFATPAFSPDGKRVALAIGGPPDVWVYDIASAALMRLTTDAVATDMRPAWSADGRLVYFVSNLGRGTGAPTRLWSQVFDGSTPPVLVAGARGSIEEVEPSRDGKTLVLTITDSAGGRNIWYKNLTGDTALKPLLTSPFNEIKPSLSPDGKWLAYVSDESGTQEVYVRAFPGPPSKWQVSTGGGVDPRWSPDGKRIFYSPVQREMMVAMVATQPTFAVLNRTRLFRAAFLRSAAHANYDVAPDGKHLLMVYSGSDSTNSVVGIANWFDDIRARLAKR